MKRIILIFVAVATMCGLSFNASAETLNAKSDVSVVAGDDWDDLLDEYEKYVNKYIEVYKKAMAGDASAMAEYAELAAQAQKLAKQIEKAKGDMTSAQLQRYTKITAKMASAL